jgi:hypothetical protein
MSHAATHWAIQQRGLAPATKLVLWFLADRHNPDFGCYPSQEQLAEDCEMSRASVNRHLHELEERGLIRRERRVDPQTRRQMPTRYFLAFEPGFGDGGATDAGPEPCPESRHGSGTDEEHAAEPCLNLQHGSEQSRVSDSLDSVSHSCATLTSKRTGKLKEEEEEGAPARACEAGSGGTGAEPWPAQPDPADVLRRVLVAVGHDPDLWVPAWWRGPAAEANVGRWVAALGADRVVEVAAETRRENPEPPDGPKALDRAMARAARVQRAASGRAAAGNPASGEGSDLRDAVDLLGRAIAEGRFVPPGAVTPRAAREMLARGLVTEDHLRRLGIAA